MKMLGTSPRKPRRLFGAISPRYIGTTLRDIPTAAQQRSTNQYRGKIHKMNITDRTRNLRRTFQCSTIRKGDRVKCKFLRRGSLSREQWCGITGLERLNQVTCSTHQAIGQGQSLLVFRSRFDCHCVDNTVSVWLKFRSCALLCPQSILFFVWEFWRGKVIWHGTS